MYQVRNSSPGPRYFTHSGGSTTVGPDSVSEPLALTADDIKAIEEHPDLEVERAKAQLGNGGGDADQAPALAGMRKDQLLAVAEDEGVDAVDRDGGSIPVNEATNAEIRAAIEAKRAG